MSSGKGLGFGIDDVAPIQIAAGQTQHQHLRRGQIAGIGDVVLVAQAIDVGDVLVGGLVAGIVEAQHQIDLVVGDAGSDLLAAAVGEGQEPVDGQPRGVGDDLAGGGSGAQGMLSQDPAVGGAELSHQLLFVIMGDQGDIHVIRSSLLWIQIRIRGIRCPMMRRAIFS